MANRLYVGNIPFKASEESIRLLFAGIGEVVSLQYVRDSRTGKPKGVAFVVMASAEEAGRAIESLHGAELLGRPLNVSLAHSQEPKERLELDTAVRKRKK